jgi:hypothetical protein
MYVVYYLQNEHTKEMKEPFFGSLRLKKWNPKYFFTHTKEEDEEECGEANLKTLSATESPYGALSGTQELRENRKQVCKSLTERSKHFRKLMFLYRHSLKEDNQLYGKFETKKAAEMIKTLHLDVEKFCEQCKGAEAIEKRLKFITVERDQLIRDQEAVMHEDECVSGEIEMAKKDIGDIKVKLENFRDQCKEAEPTEEQLKFITEECEELRKNTEAVIYHTECLSGETDATTNMNDLKLRDEDIREQCKEEEATKKLLKLVTVECDQLIRDQEAVMYEVECVSGEIEMVKKDIGDIKLKLENFRDQCKEAEAIEKQLKLVIMECDELIKDQEAVMYEVECVSGEITRKNMDGLKLKVENIREKCNESEALQKQLNFVTEHGDYLRGKDNEAVIHGAKSLSKDA